MKWLIRIFGIVIIVPILTFFLWYKISFLPYTYKLNERIRLGEQAVSGVTDIQKLVVAIEGKDGIRIYAMRNSYRTLILKNKYQGMSAWHLNNALWYYSSKLYYNDNDMFFLWVTFAPSQKEIGLKNTAKYYFDKELNDLSLREKAQIVLMVRSPSLYKLGSPELNERVDSELQKLQNK